MANQQQIDLTKQSITTWNEWRRENPDIKVDLSEIDLAGVNLSGANFAQVNFSGADLTSADLNETDLTGATLFMANLVNTNLNNSNLGGADLTLANLTAASLIGAELIGAIFTGANLVATKFNRANLSGTNFSNANLSKADLSGANLSGTNLSRAKLGRANVSEADLTGANLSEADLTGANLFAANIISANLSMAILNSANLEAANLSGANLNKASLIETNLRRAALSRCSVYGISTWNVQLEGARQDSLVITLDDEPTITTDDLAVAQFLYLLLDNQNIRSVIDAITYKLVLILGRFTPERKSVLNALRAALRTHGYVPILFDFDKPSSRSLTETVTTLAHLARFIIADLTEPSSIPYELQAIIPTIVVPVQPILQPLLLLDNVKPRHEYAMFHDLRMRYHWVLPTYQYRDIASLLASIKENVIEPAEQKAKELETR